LIELLVVLLIMGLMVGLIGVSPVSTTKVRKAESSARPMANGASNLRSGQPRGSAIDGSNEGAGVSALVIAQMSEMG